MIKVEVMIRLLYLIKSKNYEDTRTKDETHLDTE